MIQALNFVLVHVANVAEARAFYIEKLGFTVEAEAPGFVQFTRADGASYALSQAGPGEEGTELWWFVDDADATHAALEAAGVPTVRPPHDEPFGRAFAMKDPSGNLLYMLQLARPS